MLAPKKSIDVKQTLYHLFKLSNIMYILFDDLMDLPIEYGSLNRVDPAISSVRKHVSNAFIIYYDRDTKLCFKKNEMKTRVNNNKPIK